MTVTKDTTEQADQVPTTSPSSGPGTTTQAMKDHGQAPDRVRPFRGLGLRSHGSSAQHRVLVRPHHRMDTALRPRGPEACERQLAAGLVHQSGLRFPLNLITTVAELFIGFLVATAANRAQNALTALLDKIDMQEERIGETEGNIVRLIQENSGIISDIHTLTTQVAKDTALINEVHRHVSALTAHFGLEAGAFPPDETEPPATPSG